MFREKTPKLHELINRYFNICKGLLVIIIFASFANTVATEAYEPLTNFLPRGWKVVVVMFGIGIILRIFQVVVNRKIAKIDGDL